MNTLQTNRTTARRSSATVTVYEFVTHRKKVSDSSSDILNNSAAVIRLLKETVYGEQDSWREKCVAVYLNKIGAFLGYEVLSVGVLDSTAFDPKPICRTAIQMMADAVIMVHNHPTGNPKPSTLDFEQTARLRRPLSAVQCRLTDAIILGENTYYSFTEESEKKY